MVYKLPLLSYDYNALEPFFDEQTMFIHHTKHHQNYINNTNIILKQNNIKDININTLLSKINNFSLTEQQKISLYNNAGGHANHSFFWTILKKNITPNNIISEILTHHFGSIDNFKQEFEQKALNFFGSGWIWLVSINNKLKITTTINQYNPLMHIKTNNFIGSYPLIGLDLWEHAYYLKYQNQKNLYIQSFWNVLNWDKVTELFLNKN
ncbi:superoxide dismutase [Enterobacteriaceae endosymbiont of Neohaemonia nigricornis]|uniref:superoxide dismutase n=1 Tax=Enterobacteriaceae endosymbiont of Neohaemonia nigricornis TaxID=2675792 RepID=UPI001449CC18|nr:Fe-Mn family superoxide dismutase [Enterobacteriaceae endosymbiont of Neohaemonia nigricornis]QJC30439.1 superoxide dismutase [Mn] [Enterobacteriaceae endosymbiont of Neohaemonia nigricornis]